MKEVLSLFTFAIGTLCFVVFVAQFKPDAISAVPAPTKLARCSTQASSPPACHRTSLPQWPRISWDARDSVPVATVSRSRPTPEGVTDSQAGDRSGRLPIAMRYPTCILRGLACSALGSTIVTTPSFI